MNTIMNLILILIKMLEMITFGVGRSIRNLLEGIQERTQNNYCRPDDKMIKNILIMDKNIKRKDYIEKC